MTEPLKYSKIMVPTDGSKYALYAARHAVYLAKSLGAEGIVLNVVESDLAFHSGIHFSGEVSEMERSGVEVTAAARALFDEAGVPAKEIIAKGSPVDVILRVARDEGADCIVMGTVGMSAVERVLMGSVSARVSHHAPCPVLLVRMP